MNHPLPHADDAHLMWLNNEAPHREFIDLIHEALDKGQREVIIAAHKYELQTYYNFTEYNKQFLEARGYSVTYGKCSVDSVTVRCIIISW